MFFALALLPAAMSVRAPELLVIALAMNAAVIALCAADFLRAPRAASLRATRQVPGVLSCGIVNRVGVTLEAAPGFGGLIVGEWEDSVSPGPVTEGRRQHFELRERLRTFWKLTPLRRGDLSFGSFTLRLWGPFGLCGRQFSLPMAAAAKVYPDVTVLERDAMALATAQLNESRRVVKKIADGREFESLREYRLGDDRRHLDWKATARRAKAMVRVYQPEQNQAVMILLDCGRHMAGEIDGRRKVDLAVDATLRLARACVEQGDQVGVIAFATTVKAALAPQKGRAALKAMSELLYRVDASLEESDYALAIDRALLRTTRRTLVVLLTELVEPESAEVLWRHTRRLAPRHLPMVVSLKDTLVETLSASSPASPQAAYERRVAQRLESAFKKTAATLREAGARVVRTSAREFGTATVNAYLEIKARGLL
jgi:uncharacterized protein (DUF58 family)